MGEKLYPEVMDLKDKLLKWYECRVAIDMACGDLHENTPLLKEAAETIAALRAELDLCETTHANLNDEYHVLKKKMEEKDRDINHLWQRDSVWRAKKEMLENDLAKVWERLEEAERDFGLFKKTNDELRAKVTKEFTKRRAAQARADQAERERDSLKIVGEEISKQCTILNNKLARYREGVDPVITLLKDGFDPGSMLVREKIREAIKAVEGEDARL